MTRCRPWNRRLWGAVFFASGDALLIGEGWDHEPVPHHPGVPTRPMLWTTRAAARAWCAAQNQRYVNYPTGHVCHTWRMRPVRVRETVRVVPRGAR